MSPKTLARTILLIRNRPCVSAGGIVWLTHRFANPTRAQKRNDKVWRSEQTPRLALRSLCQFSSPIRAVLTSQEDLKAVQEVMRVLKKAAEIEKTAAK